MVSLLWDSEQNKAQTDRQTDRRAGRQAGRQAPGHVDKERHDVFCIATINFTKTSTKCTFWCEVFWYTLCMQKTEIISSDNFYSGQANLNTNRFNKKINKSPTEAHLTSTSCNFHRTVIPLKCPYESGEE